MIQSGTGTAADYGCPAAGKTGTTSNYGRPDWATGIARAAVELERIEGFRTSVRRARLTCW